MASNDVNQLAATLKAAGLCASLYDAKNMAESISDTAKKRHDEVEAKIVKHMGTGKRDEGFEVIKERVGPDTQPKPNSFIAQKMEQSDEEVFVNKDSLGVEVGKAESVVKMIEEDTPDEPSGPEPESPEPDEPEPEPEEPEKSEQVQSSLSIFEESKEKPDIVVEEASQEQEVKAEVEPQKQEPGPNSSGNENLVNKKAVEKPVETAKPQPINPRNVSGLREVPVDKQKPRAQLTEEQKESTDLTKWFYFGNK